MVPSQLYGEPDGVFHLPQILGEPRQVRSVRRLDDRPVLEHRAVAVQSIAHARDREAVALQEAPHVCFAKRLVLGKTQVVVRIELARHHFLEPVEHRQDAERDHARQYRRIIEPRAIEDAERGRHPDRGRGGQATHHYLRFPKDKTLGEAVAFQEAPHVCFAKRLVLGKTQVVVRIELARHHFLEPVEHRQDAERDHARQYRRIIEPRAIEDAERGRHPDRGRGGQATHRQALPEDHAGAEKANAGHDPLGDARRIGADHLGRRANQPLPLIGRQQHQQRRGDAHQRMGPKARRAAVVGPFQPDQAAGDQCAAEIESDGQIVVHDSPSM